MADNVNPSYADVAKSGISSQTKPAGRPAPYTTASLGGLAFPYEDDLDPVLPEHTPEQTSSPYTQIKN